MYLLYSSPRRAPFTTIPSTLLLQSDCIARVTESMVVCPMRTTRRVPWQSVESRLASAAKSKGGLSRMIQLNSVGKQSTKCLTNELTSETVAVLRGDSNIKGVVTFEQSSESNPTTISWEITGHDANAERGMHVHAFGDNTNGCTSAGPHCRSSSYIGWEKV